MERFPSVAVQAIRLEYFGSFYFFWFLPGVSTVALMTILTFVVLMCYGGGFGTMPAF